jgi:hypothetical protein
VRTRDGIFMRWADNRLMRRMIRDSWHRNLQPMQTLTHWHYVRRSELKNIIPFISSVDYVVNSAMPHELPILKHKLFKFFPEAMERTRTTQAPGRLHPRQARPRHARLWTSPKCRRRAIPDASLLREFIGGSLLWDGRTYERLDACVDLFPRILDFLEQCIRDAAGDVIQANDAINAHFQMTNDFPIFMALVDLALFRPDLIRPDSPVPTGIGAAPFLDRLQAHLGCRNHQDTADTMIRLQPSIGRRPNAYSRPSISNTCPANAQVLQLCERHEEIRGQEPVYCGDMNKPRPRHLS